MDRRRGRILIVDEADAARELIELLRGATHRVAVAPTFELAVDALTHMRFDLVLVELDCLSDEAAGVPHAAEHILARAGYTPVVLLMSPRERALANVAARGFAGQLLKPYARDELLATVRQWLAS